MVDARRVRSQTHAFTKNRPNYERLAEALEQILTKAQKLYAPYGIVSARVKSIPSFAEKAIRKQEKYQYPSRQLTDLAGGRVITYTQAEADAICRWLEQENGFTIDWPNSENTRRRLSVREFDYVASHYIVQLSGPRILGVKIEPGLRKLKCEIQITTFLQHVWSAIGHDRIYKSNLRIPEQIKRKAAATAALLELAESTFADTIKSLDQYLIGFATSLDPKGLDREITRWQAVLSVDPHGLDSNEIRCRLGQLYLAKRDPRAAYGVMRPLKDSDHPVFLRDFGRAAARDGKKEVAREHLERSIGMDGDDWMTHRYLGDLDLVRDPETAMECYERAHRLEPEEPRVLVPFLESVLRVKGDLDVLKKMRGSLQSGIAECEKRIALQIHVPQAYLEKGRLALYLEPASPYTALSAYAKALVDWRHQEMVEDELRAIERIIEKLDSDSNAREGENESQWEGFLWVREFLKVVLVARARGYLREQTGKERGKEKQSGKDKKARENKRKENAPLLEKAKFWATSKHLKGIATDWRSQGYPRPGFGSPVVIIAGGCAPEAEQRVSELEGLLRKAFKGFAGTAIGGGTKAGISGLAARLLRRKKDVALVGYLPPEDARPKEDEPDPAYHLVYTRGRGYTPLGPLQTWADLLMEGIAPEDVRVLGVNGGDLAGFEYRLGLAVGSTVGVVQGTGRQAESLLPDAFWRKAPGFAPLPKDWASIAAFVNWGQPSAKALRGRTLDRLARRAHGNYRSVAIKNPKKVPHNLLPWESLPETLKFSNRHQIRYSVLILRAAGFDVVPTRAKKRMPRIPDSFEDRVEFMAEMEHGRYLAERLSDGWRMGDVNDEERRINPSLVPWSELDDKIKDLDRDAVREWPELLWKAGLKIQEASSG